MIEEILTPAAVRSVRPIADNLEDTKRITPYLREVERLDLLPMMGASLYRDVAASLADEEDEFQLLYHGGYYEYNGKTEWCDGLVSACGYLAYARFARNQDINVTAFGVVRKTTQYSEPTDSGELLRTANEAERIGTAMLATCKQWLERNGYIGGCVKGGRPMRRIKAI